MFIIFPNSVKLWLILALKLILPFHLPGKVATPESKGFFTKNQDFHILDYVKVISVIERIMGFDHDLFFCGPPNENV